MFNWIQNIADWFVYDVLNLEKEQHLVEALNFFIYDTVKILILLFVVIFFMGIVNSYFPIDKVKNYLSRNKLYGLEYLMASLFGVVTPFCSCSSVPLFIGFVRGGIPLGVTFAFLITSPLVNEVAIGLFVGLFGFKMTIIYVLSGILLGTISGVILQKLKLEPFLTPWVKEVLANAQREQDKFEAEQLSFSQRLPIIWAEVIKILKGIIPFVIIGIAIGGLMHGYIPEGFFEQYMAKDNLFAVPIATILAVPMYANASGILPVVQVLVAKGIPIGTAIAFMMGVVGLSLPEAMLLKKVMSLKLIAIFFGVVTLCIIISGYFFNLIL
ncbi:permease [Polaribacter reichenbachii]|uniref:Permease n=1 Tax=Polaribacter reichenbachii TaxID=996801 RepID=A0A1B8TPT2_9FLAO|nr:permease [Polaribacter reichenbachii]APZ46844.1 permease [Polaribacter reichenbachii]AUC17487.1 permease [Polaribacter reichenbachii]OBY61637.1 permease [Polaribacter reichenbachii]